MINVGSSEERIGFRSYVTRGGVTPVLSTRFLWPMRRGTWSADLDCCLTRPHPQNFAYALLRTDSNYLPMRKPVLPEEEHGGRGGHRHPAQLGLLAEGLQSRTVEI